MKSDVIFDKIRERIAKNAVDSSYAPPVEGIFQFNLTSDGDVQSWVLDFKKVELTKGSATSPDVIVTASDEDFFLLGDNQISGKDALMSGKVKIDGDKALAHKFLSHMGKPK